MKGGILGAIYANNALTHTLVATCMTVVMGELASFRSDKKMTKENKHALNVMLLAVDYARKSTDRVWEKYSEVEKYYEDLEAAATLRNIENK